MQSDNDSAARKSDLNDLLGGSAEWLHLYPGAYWHDDGAIVGTRAGLADLHAAIGAALEHGNSVAKAFVNDGEGYCVFIHCVDEADMQKMALPYTEESAREMTSGDAIWPAALESRAAEAYRARFLTPNP